MIIRPSIEYKIGRLERDKEKLQYMYNLGRQDANTKLEEIKVFLAEK